jgi:hypothetical protein
MNSRFVHVPVWLTVIIVDQHQHINSIIVLQFCHVRVLLALMMIDLCRREAVSSLPAVFIIIPDSVFVCSCCTPCAVPALLAAVVTASDAPILCIVDAVAAAARD